MHQSRDHTTFVRALLPAFMLLLLVLAVWATIAPETALAQSKTTSQPQVSSPGQEVTTAGAAAVEQKQTVTPMRSELEAYARKGYKRVGPVQVSSFEGQTLKLYTSVGDITVALQGKNFVVKDENAQLVAQQTIRKGSRVYVCRNDAEVIVYVLTSRPAVKGDIAQ